MQQNTIAVLDTGSGKTMIAVMLIKEIAKDLKSKVMAMAVVAAVALVLHVALSWLLIVQFQLGLAGAAISLNFAWWFSVIAQFIYIAMGCCPGAWTGFSWSAFKDLGNFAKLSIGSAIMLCLEFWYIMFLIVIVGNLKNAKIAVAAISICINIDGWVLMVFLGFNAAISVRISNELGARRRNAAKFSILIVIIWSVLIGLIAFSLVIALKDSYGLPFTNSPEVAHAVTDLAVLFAFTILLNSVQPVLTGVAVGAGWQWLVAYINLGCYYIIGIPTGNVERHAKWNWITDIGVDWHHIVNKLDQRGNGS